MSERRAPAWLGELQARFGEMLRTPLDRSTGRLRAQPERYPAQLLNEVRSGAHANAGERLAVYNRQYWFRLLSTVHSGYPLTLRLLGAWRFNEHAARFLGERPLAAELTRLADGFADFLGQQSLPEAALEAALVDQAYRHVAQAPLQTPFRPGPADAQRLFTARLVQAPSAAIVREHWPLCELRRELLADESGHEAPLTLPPRHAQPSCWLLVRDAERLSTLALATQEAALLELLGAHPVAEALARLEAHCAPEERAALPAQAQRWLARSVKRGFWSGLRDDLRTLEPEP